ncbi:MAG: DEAD/DEAH box helicase [Bacteroidota bacterium]
MFEQSSLADRFRRRKQLTSNSGKGDLLFQLAFDSVGAYLTVIDQRGREIQVDYANYSGPIRSVLRVLQQLEERQAFVIDWAKPSDRIYLGEHEFLLWQLKLCDNLVDENGSKLGFAEGQAQVGIQIEPIQEGSSLRSFLVTQREGHIAEDLMVISESFVLCDQLIYEIPPLGEVYEDLYLFQTEFSQKELEPFLSLLFSYVGHVQVRYRGYQVRRLEEAIVPQLCLILEQIDEEEALHLRLSQQLSGLGFDFLETYELYHLAEVNDLERIITIRPIDQIHMGIVQEEVLQLIRKHAPSSKERKEIVALENRYIIPKETAAGFIYHELPNLLNRFLFFGAEKLRSYKVKAFQPKLNLSLQSGIDFFEGVATLDFEGESISVMDALNQYREQRYIKLSDGTHAIVNQEYLKKLERLFRKGKKNKQIKLSFFDLPEVEQLLNEKVHAEIFSRPRKVFEGFNKIQEMDLPLPQVNATLRPYQEYGYRWLHYLHEHRIGACLADDMGLGKTLQTLTILSETLQHTDKPSLLVMPRSLLFNWEHEIRSFTPHLSSITYYGSQRSIEEAMKHQLILTTYGTMRNDIERLKELTFFYVVLDESQNIKNYQSQASKAVSLLQADHRLALSGTPIENNLGELYSLFRFLNPAMFGSVREFNEFYATPIQRENNKEVAAALRVKIYPFVLRRLKRDVLDDLPDKIEQVLYVEMSPEQKRLYEQRRTFYQDFIQNQIAADGLQKARFAILQGLSELRQLASIPEAKTDGRIRSPKLEVLEERLTDAFANGHKVLIFANFLVGIETIGEVLNKLGVDFVAMTGATRDRQQQVERFQQDENCMAFLMTLKTGSLGLNLTAADTIFLYDPWWNVAAENQAIDRAHRIGQTQKVTSYKLIARGTIEEKILELQQKKRELFDQIISTDTTAFKALTEADIEYVLS